VDIGSQMLMGEEKASDHKHEHQPEHLRDENLWGDGCKKQMRPGPATRAALLSRTF
jgi:hypothetical protein